MLGKGDGKITFGNGVIVPLVLCDDSELVCIKVQFGKSSLTTGKQRVE